MCRRVVGVVASRRELQVAPARVMHRVRSSLANLADPRKPASKAPPPEPLTTRLLLGIGVTILSSFSMGWACVQLNSATGDVNARGTLPLSHAQLTVCSGVMCVIGLLAGLSPQNGPLSVSLLRERLTAPLPRTLPRWPGTSRRARPHSSRTSRSSASGGGRRCSSPTSSSPRAPCSAGA